MLSNDESPPCACLGACNCGASQGMKSNPGRGGKKSPPKKSAAKKKAASKKPAAKKAASKATAKSGSQSRPRKLEGPRFDVAHVPVGGQHAPGPNDPHFRVVDRKAKRGGGSGMLLDSTNNCLPFEGTEDAVRVMLDQTLSAIHYKALSAGVELAEMPDGGWWIYQASGVAPSLITPRFTQGPRKGESKGAFRSEAEARAWWAKNKNKLGDQACPTNKAELSAVQAQGRLLAAAPVGGLPTGEAPPMRANPAKPKGTVEERLAVVESQLSAQGAQIGELTMTVEANTEIIDKAVTVAQKASDIVQGFDGRLTSTERSFAALSGVRNVGALPAGGRKPPAKKPPAKKPPAKKPPRKK